MKNLIYFLVVILVIISCKNKTESEVITITVDDVKNVVEYLASDDIRGREVGSGGIDKSATYIETTLNNHGIKPYFETYRDNFKVDSLDAFNVVGFLEGNDPKLKEQIVILGAHYDHIGTMKSIDNDSIANGANDNATGTSFVLTMAKYFAAKKNNKRSIMFALFSAEEKGLLGSKHLAEKLKNQNIELYTMVNFEMVGVPFQDRGYEVFTTGYDLSNMAETINTYVSSSLVGKSEVSIKYNLFERSDNYPFYEQFKVPCQTISSCDLSNFDFYHHVDDEVDKIDFEFMTSLINKLIPAIEKISNTASKEIKMKNE